MPYDYELLKNHISTAHPEIFDAFVEGWNILDPKLQAYWSQGGLIMPRQKVEPKAWLSWTTVKVDQFFESRAKDFSTDLLLFEKRLTVLFHNNIQHSGHLFNLPYLPPIENRVYRPPGTHYESLSERHIIAKDAAKFIIHIELRKLLMKWKKDLKENGLDALREVYLDEPQLEEDVEEGFNLEDFDLNFDCKSLDGSDDDSVDSE